MNKSGTNLIWSIWPVVGWVVSTFPTLLMPCPSSKYSCDTAACVRKSNASGSWARSFSAAKNPSTSSVCPPSPSCCRTWSTWILKKVKVFIADNFIYTCKSPSKDIDSLFSCNLCSGTYENVCSFDCLVWKWCHFTMWSNTQAPSCHSHMNVHLDMYIHYNLVEQEAQRATYRAPEYNVPPFWGICQGSHLVFPIGPINKLSRGLWDLASS